MSTATTTANLFHQPHAPHTAHPIPLREQAFSLHCQGLRSPAIAAELGVPERTVRAWINAALDDLKDDLQLSRKEQLLLAVERQHQLTATAWQQFKHEAAARDALLEATLDTLLNTNDSQDAASASALPLHLHLPASTPAPRYLSLIVQANKEINRLLGLYTLAKLHLLTPDVPDTDPVLLTDSDRPAETATDSTIASGHAGVAGWTHPAGYCENPAKTAIDMTAESAPASADSHFPAKMATSTSPLVAGRTAVSDSMFSDTDSHSTAGTATASPPQCHSVSSVVTPALPAESATATALFPFVSSVDSVLNSRPPAKMATAPSHPTGSGCADIRRTDRLSGRLVVERAVLTPQR